MRMEAVARADAEVAGVKNDSKEKAELRLAEKMARGVQSE